MTQSTNEFEYLKIKLASPARIFQWTNRRLPNGQFVGEVQKSETINYRTFKPEMDGLFCERIFGPSKSLECTCGKYKRVRYEGLVCDRCGVELTESRVRRHRMGFVNLIYPVMHIWYFTSRPNYMALLLEVEQPDPRHVHEDDYKSTHYAMLDERVKKLSLILFAYLMDEGSEFSFYSLHFELQFYRRIQEKFDVSHPDFLDFYWPSSNSSCYNRRSLLRITPNFLVGASLVQRELERLDLNAETKKTRNFVSYLNLSVARKWKLERLQKLRRNGLQRIRVLESLQGTGANPSWMIFSILPVIPPSLRPMIQLDGGRFATSDLNELYRRIITRNNRLLRLLEIDAPQVVIRNEKRLLQESVDTLIDNGKRGKIALSSNNRPLKSLSEIIKGKHGRFRQNLLGKRVDYSGRSVIVVGPSLKLNQCGLPYEMVVELFQPFIIRELIDQGLASNIKTAKNVMEQNESIMTPVLDKILKTHPIFLNRAPTLHRLGVQAFEPIIVPGRAIKLHPLVCAAFNADFDGDQMAVHVPLSPEAQAECYMLMLAPYNFLSPANGEPIIMPSQDMVLGCYYLTVNNINGLLGSNHYFANLEDVILAYNQKKIEIHTSIWVRYTEDNLKLSKMIRKTVLKDGTYIEYYENVQLRKTADGETLVQYLQTTTGRVILNYTIQTALQSL
jgi:DNA-directed RNA polymerase subunit beta'